LSLSMRASASRLLRYGSRQLGIAVAICLFLLVVYDRSFAAGGFSITLIR
jgi:hypothetical protein